MLKKVVDEELKEVEEYQKRLRHLKPYLFQQSEEQKPHGATIDDLESEPEDENIEEIRNKPVDRKNKLTKT